MDFLLELSSYYNSGMPAILEKVMIFGMVIWLCWCARLFFLPDDGVMPTDAKSTKGKEDQE